LKFLIDLVGANRVAYGTDYPFPLGDLEHGRFIEEMNELDASAKEFVFSRSVCDFLGIDIRKYHRTA
jgi:aminocarboxymuconate-semialdehyde decarboxylase